MPHKSIISPVPRDKRKAHHSKAMLIQGLPQSTREYFKAACAMRGRSMRDVIIELMRRYVEEVRRQ
jgi:hypothetical protein